ncbi:sensor histidine kinase [Hymenobacter tenuis]
MVPAVPPEATLSEADLLARLFPKGGEMGQRVRQLDWSQTPLGPVHGWPLSLRGAVSIMLNSRFPMMVHWGPELVHFYNDGYAAILQDKHPGALGQPAEPWWREMWPFLLDIFTRVLAGETTYFENGLVLPNRRGFIEEAYFTFSHSPIYDEAGRVGGIFVTALETTVTVVQQRRLALFSHLNAQTTLVTLPAEAAQHIIAALATNQADIPFALLYTHDQPAAQAQLRAWFGLPAGEPVAPATVDVAGPAADEGWPLAAALAPGRGAQVVSLPERFAHWPAGSGTEPPTQALLLPLAVGDALPGSRAVLIMGVSARRPLDEAYRTFFELVADYAGRALARTITLHEAERLNQALRAVNTSLDTFVHIVAHDLKGPAMNLSSLLQVYHEEAPGPARDHLIDLVGQEIRRLESTIRGLLQVLHIQYGTDEAQSDAVAWPDVYAAVRGEVAELLAQQQGILTADFAAAPVLYYPQAYLHSILKNLVHNALKYRAPERPPVVHVQTQRRVGSVVLTVTDNGRGIDLPRDQDRLFQPFTRLSPEGEGVGLGLHIIRSLIHQRGGSLEVASTLGVGTTFTVTLPDQLPLGS